MNLLEATRRIVQLERERDSAREENVKLRDKLLEIAKECANCHGTGLYTRSMGGGGDPEWDADDQPCPDCRDIRDVLA